MARIAYVRVSTAEQNTARQDIKFKGYDKVFTEKASGKNTDRTELNKMLDYVREGDSVTVESYSRLARNTKDLLTIVDQLKEKGVAFISLKENVDTSTPQGEFMMQVFASLAEFERKQTLQRQAEGIAAAKEKGVRFGRTPMEQPPEYKEVYETWSKGELSARAAARNLGISHQTFLKWTKNNGRRSIL